MNFSSRKNHFIRFHQLPVYMSVLQGLLLTFFLIFLFAYLFVLLCSGIQPYLRYIPYGSLIVTRIFQESFVLNLWIWNEEYQLLHLVFDSLFISKVDLPISAFFTVRVDVIFILEALFFSSGVIFFQVIESLLFQYAIFSLNFTDLQSFSWFLTLPSRSFPLVLDLSVVVQIISLLSWLFLWFP